MVRMHEIVFLFDVDDTLLDNDALKTALKQHVLETFGPEACDRFWVLYEEQRVKYGYADFLGTIERFRLEHLNDPQALRIANWLMDYPFADLLYPDALAAVRHVRQWGLPVILTDGDGVFQPHKLEHSGLWKAFDGCVLDYVHKERELADVERAYPARHYVVMDDKRRVLDAIKKAWGDRVTTVFVRQGHYAHDPKVAASYPPADVTLERIAELLNHEFSALLPV